MPWLNAAANLVLDTGERSAIWDQSDVVVALNYATRDLDVPLDVCVNYSSVSTGSGERTFVATPRSSTRRSAYSRSARSLSWASACCFVPVVVTGAPDLVGQDGEVALARELYAQAYQPVRSEATLDALERQHSLLGAADALEKRARAIHDWPVAEGTWAWVIGIATSVVAIACARLILRRFGF